MKVKLVLLLSGIILIGIFGTLSVYFGFIVISVEELNMDLNVENRVGFNTGTDAIHFGTIYPGGESKRSVNIANNNKFPIVVYITNGGELAKWVESENIIELKPGENISIDYVVTPPPFIEERMYYGTSKITMNRKFF